MEELTGLPCAVGRLEAVAGLARRAPIVRGGACAVCAAAGRARAATPRPREDAAALPNIPHPSPPSYGAPATSASHQPTPPRRLHRRRTKGSESAYAGGVAFLTVARLPIGVFRRRPRPNRPRRTHHRRRGSLAGCRRSGVCVVEKVGEWVRGGAVGGMEKK
jgi:hypothetical protein